MKKLIQFICILCIFHACVVTKYQDAVVGTFIGNTPRYGSFVPPGEMVIHLKSDGKFDINWLDVDYSGAWKISDKNKIVLQFDEITDISILLRSGTLSGENKIIYFITKNKIKFDWNVLKRIQ